MRLGPAIRAASFVDLSSCLPAARSSETTVLVRQHSHLRGAPLLPALAAEHDSQNMIRRTIALQPLRRPAAQLAQRASCRGGRNARATGTRSRALPIFPRQFTLENCQSATGSANIHHSASRENYHVFAEPTLKQNVAPRNRKTFRSCEQTVDDETCLWKPEEKPAPIAAQELSASIFQ
jgi:hypothetical protein